MTSRDPRLDTLLQHKGSLIGGMHKYRRPQLRTPYPDEHVAARQLEQQKLKPLYTKKLPTSPAFKTVAELAQRRRNFWSKVVARGAIGLIVGSGAATLWLGTSAAFKAFGVIGGAGLIIFIATCFYSGCRNRNRLL